MLNISPLVRTLGFQFKRHCTCSTYRELNSGDSQSSGKVSSVSVPSEVEPRDNSFKVIRIANNNAISIVSEVTFYFKVPIIGTTFCTFVCSCIVTSISINLRSWPIISGIFGYNPTEKLIVGFEVLESKETPGLGDKIIKDPAFRENFTALAVEPRITTVKEGQKNNPHEVEMITGATISSRTVVKLINKALGTTKEAMEEFAISKQESDGGE